MIDTFFYLWKHFPSHYYIFLTPNTLLIIFYRLFLVLKDLYHLFLVFLTFKYLLPHSSWNICSAFAGTECTSKQWFLRFLKLMGYFFNIVKEKFNTPHPLKNFDTFFLNCIKKNTQLLKIPCLRVGPDSTSKKWFLWFLLLVTFSFQLKFFNASGQV